MKSLQIASTIMAMGGLMAMFIGYVMDGPRRESWGTFGHFGLGVFLAGLATKGILYVASRFL